MFQMCCLSHRARNDFLEVHLHRAEKVLGEVGAMEADGLVRIVTVVIVPVEQCRRRLASQWQRIHAEHAADVHFAGARHQFVAHHAHDGAGHDAEDILPSRSSTARR